MRIQPTYGKSALERAVFGLNSVNASLTRYVAKRLVIFVISYNVIINNYRDPHNQTRAHSNYNFQSQINAKVRLSKFIAAFAINIVCAFNI